MNKKNQNIRTGHTTKIITYKLGIFYFTTTPIFLSAFHQLSETAIRFINNAVPL
jgi:hypothetical protein